MFRRATATLISVGPGVASSRLLSHGGHLLWGVGRGRIRCMCPSWPVCAARPGKQTRSYLIPAVNDMTNAWLIHVSHIKLLVLCAQSFQTVRKQPKARLFVSNSAIKSPWKVSMMKMSLNCCIIWHLVPSYALKVNGVKYTPTTKFVSLRNSDKRFQKIENLVHFNGNNKSIT